MCDQLYCKFQQFIPNVADLALYNAPGRFGRPLFPAKRFLGISPICIRRPRRWASPPIHPLNSCWTMPYSRTRTLQASSTLSRAKPGQPSSLVLWRPTTTTCPSLPPLRWLLYQLHLHHHSTDTGRSVFLQFHNRRRAGHYRSADRWLQSAFGNYGNRHLRAIYRAVQQAAGFKRAFRASRVGSPARREYPSADRRFLDIRWHRPSNRSIATSERGNPTGHPRSRSRLTPPKSRMPLATLARELHKRPSTSLSPRLKPAVLC